MIERSGEELGELIRAWLQKHAITLILAIIAVIVIIGGIDWWRNAKIENARATSAIVVQINDAIAANDNKQATHYYEQIEDDHVLKPMAALLMATIQTPDQRQAFLELARTSDDFLIQQTAKWQLAQLWITQTKYDQAKAALDELKHSIYASQVPILQALVAQLEGDPAAALAAYEQALQNNPAASVLLEGQITALKAELMLAQ